MLIIPFDCKMLTFGVSFLQQLVNLKLDQGSNLRAFNRTFLIDYYGRLSNFSPTGILLLGADNPLLKILQTGSTSVFLTLTKFLFIYFCWIFIIYFLQVLPSCGVCPGDAGSIS